MEKTKRWIKHNLLFFISLVVLFLALVFSIVIFQLFRLQSQTESTRVGYIYLGANESSYERILSEEVGRFLDQAEYEIVYQNLVMDLDVSLFDFDVNETMNVLNANQNNDAIFEITSTSLTTLSNSIAAVFGADLLTDIDIEGLSNGIISSLADLDYFHQIELQDYLYDASQRSEIQSKSFTLNDATVLDALSSINEITIEPNTSFSLLTYFEEASLSNQTLSFIASTMYHLALEAHFSYITSHHYTSMPAWADAYTNVQVLRQNQYDFTLYNAFDTAYTFEFSVTNANTVLVTLVGAPYANSYTFIEDSQVISYQTIYVDDTSITDPIYIVEDNDERRVYEQSLQLGADGSLTSYSILITYPDGSTETMVVDMFMDDPTPEIIGQNIEIKDGE